MIYEQLGERSEKKRSDTAIVTWRKGVREIKAT